MSALRLLCLILRSTYSFAANDAAWFLFICLRTGKTRRNFGLKLDRVEELLDFSSREIEEVYKTTTSVQATIIVIFRRNYI